MSDFFKFNKLVFGGILIAIISIGIGLATNIGGIALAGLLTLTLSIREIIRKYLRHNRYNNWIKNNSDKYVINLFSDTNIEHKLESINSMLDEQFLIVSIHKMKFYLI